MKNILKSILLVFVFCLSLISLASCDRYSGLTPEVTPTPEKTPTPTQVETEEEQPTGSEEETEGSGGSTSKSTTVKIMFHVDKNSAEGKAYQKRIDAFNAKYKNTYKASASYVARTSGASDYEAYLGNLQNEGTLPDIITFDAPNCASYANSKLLYALDDLVPEKEINDFISVSKFENKIYGLPIQESSAGFFYNKQIFAKAGIDVSGYTVDNPWTFEQFRDVCARLVNFCKNNSGYSKYAVDMRLDATKDETATYMLYSFIHAAGGEFVSPDGYTAKGYLNSNNTIKGFEFLKSLVTDGYTGYDIGATDFFTGKLGMYLSSGWTIPDLDNKFREFFPDRNSWGILPYPKDARACSATGSWCFGITNNKTQDKTAAKELLLWLTSAESSKVITDATGMIPARKSVETNYKPGDPEYVLYQQLLKTGKQRPETVGYPKLTDTINQIIYNMKSGDVKSTLNARAIELQRELDKLNKK